MTTYQCQIQLPDKKTLSLYIVIFFIILFFMFNLSETRKDFFEHDENFGVYQPALLLNPNLFGLCKFDRQWCNVYPPRNLGPIPVPAYTDHTVLFKYIIALAFYFFGESLILGRIISLIFASLSLFVVYFLAREMYGQETGVLAVFITGLTLPFINYSRKIYHDVPMTFFLLASFYFFYLGYKRDLRFVVLGGFFWGLASLTKETAILLLIPLAYLFSLSLFSIKLDKQKNYIQFSFTQDWKKILLYYSIAFFLFLFLGYLLYNLIAQYLYGFYPLLNHLYYFKASVVGKLFLPGFLRLILSVYPLSWLLFPAVIYFALKGDASDRLLVLVFALFFIHTFIYRASSINPGVSGSRLEDRWLYVTYPFAAILLSKSILLFYQKIKDQRVLFVILFLFLVQFDYQLEYYFGSLNEKRKDDLEYSIALNLLGERLDKTTPIYSGYDRNILGFSYRWYARELKPRYTLGYILKHARSKGFKEFAVLVDLKQNQSFPIEKDLSQKCNTQLLSVSQKEVFRLYKCNIFDFALQDSSKPVC